MQQTEQKEYGKQLARWLAIAAIVSLAAAPVLQQWLDTSLLFRWAQGLATGFFNAYDGHVTSLDYPPLYFPVLWVIGKIDQLFGLEGHNALIQLSLKVVPMAFYLLCSWSTYLIAGRYTSPKNAYRAALFMLLCPTLFVNAVYWAQMDAILLFFVFWFFYLLDDGRPMAATVVFVLCGVMKLQTLFFFPVFVAYLFYRFPFKKVLVCGVVGIVMAYAVFIPFMIPTVSQLYTEAAAEGLSFFPALIQAVKQSAPVRSGVLLPFHLYLGSFNSYQYASMNALNLWTACGLNMDSLTAPLIAGAAWFTPKLVGGILFAAALVFPVVYLVLAKWKRWEADVWVLAFVTMQSIYMFATKIHDRYQIMVLPLLMMIWIKKQDVKFGRAFIFTSAMTCINHLLTIVTYTNNTTRNFFFNGAGEMVYIVFAMANLALYAYTIYISLPHLFPGVKARRDQEAAAQAADQPD